VARGLFARFPQGEAWGVFGRHPRGCQAENSGYWHRAHHRQLQDDSYIVIVLFYKENVLLWFQGEDGKIKEWIDSTILVKLICNILKIC
jgi:hypothetical protein